MLQQTKAAWLKFLMITVILCSCTLENQQTLTKQKVTFQETQRTLQVRRLDHKYLDQLSPKRLVQLGVR